MGLSIILVTSLKSLHLRVKFLASQALFLSISTSSKTNFMVTATCAYMASLYPTVQIHPGACHL